MQSYKLHSISEQLKDRHPYIDPPFNDRYDPSEVYHAVFDRSVPKLIEILLMEKIDLTKYRDALITLNELVSQQETKDEMITQGLVSVVSAYLHHTQVEIRREAVLLLGSLVSIRRGREQMDKTTFEGLGKILFDDKISAREACGWCLCRNVSARDGVEIICRSALVKVLIESFLKYSEFLEIQNIKFIIYLLESFTKILEYDNGIQFFVRSGVVQRMNEILKHRRANQLSKETQLADRINYLILECLAKICANHQGKTEGIHQKVIESASEFLDSNILEESQNSTILIMNCTIHLEGKKQCIHNEIIQKLLTLLDTKNMDFRKDVKQTLVNIAEYPEGFLIITKIMANNIPYLDDLFGPRVVIALSNLLPKTSSLIKPPLLPNENFDEYKTYVKALCYFLRNYDEAHTLAIEETVKIEEKLIPFLPYRQLSDVVAHSLYSLCNFDHNCKEGLFKYLLQYGDVPIDFTKSTLKDEIKAYKKLHEILLRN